MEESYTVPTIVHVVSEAGIPTRTDPSYVDHVRRYVKKKQLFKKSREFYRVPESKLETLFEGMGWNITLDQFLMKYEEMGLDRESEEIKDQ